MLQQLTPMFFVRDIRASVKYYTEVLGFECLNIMTRCEGGEAFWASLRRGKVDIMFRLKNSVMKEEAPQYTGSFYIYVDNVDEVWEELKTKANILYDIEDFEHQMREFAITDPDGYVFNFGEDIESVKARTGAAK
ncbi:putative glyoxalase superfamily protein PhnB [Chitinophaga skermanii]|uniref:Putative glyoxalase superfamily protein PhnB n=1 Tax=Chitinophaga skermanii TaxID=331697 RepID=A0A327Q926_9BACT|nr:VOC family protein [Chitinophaga skermanii]RAI99762.1 putative glyoxalase superfamily protein PhnB [Chitinophaga skermanii]